MKSRHALLALSVCLAAFVCLHASPAHAALQSAGLLTRATEHFQTSLSKWGDIMTNAALVLFWMIATVACVWELGNLALRGGTMEAAIAFLARFSFIEGLWLYILQHAVPFGTAIINSLRKLGSIASGLPQELMPSDILDIGFKILWKTIAFVSFNSWTSPIVSAVALVMSLLILLVFALTALNMVLLLVSQWFMLYGGIFFLGFGGAPWGSDSAQNYLKLALSIGAQLMGMAAVVGLGQSFIEAQYAQLSGDTNLGELAVILVVAVLMFMLGNAIPKMFARFVPGSYAAESLGMASLLGGFASLAAAAVAAGSMTKSAAASMTGVAKAVNAAHSAAKQQTQSQSFPRSQTGVSKSSSSSSGGSIGPASGGSNGRSSTQTQGPLGAMLTSTGSASQPSNGATKNTGSARSSTNTPDAKATSTTQPPTASQNSSPPTDAEHGARGGQKEDRTASAGSTSGAGSHPSNGAARGATQAAELASQETDTSTAAEDDSEARRDPENTGDDRESTGSGDASSTDHADSEAVDSADASERGASDRPDAHGDTSAAHGDAAVEASTPPSGPASGTSDTSAAQNAPGSETSPAPSLSSSTASAAGTATASGSAAGPSNASMSSSHASTGAPTASSPTASGAPVEASGGASASAGASAGTGTQSAAAQPTSSGASTTASGSAASPASASASASAATSVNQATGPAAEAGTQRGETSSGGTLAATARILGEQFADHHRGRFEKAKQAFFARADSSTGGQIAQAIRKKYGLDEKDEDEGEASPSRAETAIESEADSPADATPNHEPSHGHASGPKHPADWMTGDDPMTEKQWAFLERKLGDDFDPNMTKAEAAMLIDELVNGD